MNYKEARTFVEESKKYEGELSLKNMEQLSYYLSYPQDDLSFVHIAGTNGKGSVSAYLENILLKSGYQVGRYVSPALLSYRESFLVGGQPISKEDYTTCMERVKKAVKKMVTNGQGHPTPFELETMCAFLYFKQQQCDLVILECGLGGDLDATNIITNTKVAVFTSISRDHMGFLGDTLKEIATHKSGIMKENACVVTTLQEKEVMQVLLQEGKAQKSKFEVADYNKAILKKVSIEATKFSFGKEEYEIRLLGKHQVENAVVAITCIKALISLGYDISKEAVVTGLKQTKWPGRFSVIDKEPYFILDGAHNKGAALQLRESLLTYFPNEKFIFIMGIFRDKEYQDILDITLPLAKEVYTISLPQEERTLDAKELKEVIEKKHSVVRACKSLEEAINLAYKTARSNGVIVAFGSLSFHKDVYKNIKNT